MNGFRLKYTSIVIPAESISRVKGEDWPAVVKYFRGMAEVTGKEPLLQKLLDALRLMPVHYIYDSNAKA